jgi:hypothetical protein
MRKIYIVIVAVIAATPIVAQAQDHMSPDQAMQNLTSIGAQWALQTIQDQAGQIKILQKQLSDLRKASKPPQAITCPHVPEPSKK